MPGLTAASSSKPQLHSPVALKAKGGDQAPAMEAGGVVPALAGGDHAPGKGGDRALGKKEAEPASGSANAPANGDGDAPAKGGNQASESANGEDHTPANGSPLVVAGPVANGWLPALPVAQNTVDRLAAATNAALGEEVATAFYLTFLRLAPADVARCRAVCRPWRDAIDTVAFHRYHHHHHCRTRMPLFCFEDPNLIRVDLWALDIPNRASVPVIRFTRPEHAVFRVHGSCDGILLLSSGTSLCACNPCTRRWARLPPLHLNHDIVGFFRGSLLEYQVLYHEHEGSRESDCKYWVFTLGNPALVPKPTCIGRPADPVPEPPIGLDLVLSNGIAPSYQIPPILVRGFLLWLPQATKNSSSILAFDASTERFSWIPPPSVEVDGQLVPVEGGQLLEMDDGLLGLTVVSPTGVDIWVLGVDMPWVYQYRIQLPVDAIKLYHGYDDQGTLNAGVFTVDQGHGQGLQVLVQCPHVLLHCDVQGSVLREYQVDADHHTFPSRRYTFRQSIRSYGFSLPLLPSDASGDDSPFFQRQ